MAGHINHNALQALPTPHPEAELLSCLTKITAGFPPQQDYNPQSCHGLYSGPTSIAYLFHHLSNSQPDLLINTKTPKYWCRTYLSGARPAIEVTPKRCGVANETLAHLALLAVHSGDESYVSGLLDQVPFALSDTVLDASNEWLYGRAGTLYLLRLVAASYPQSHQRIEHAVSQVVGKMVREGPPWFWHGKEYLGAAHGSMGILTQIILSSPTHVQQQQNLLLDLLEQQDLETGNWPSSVGSHSEGKLIQFCHGAPGFVISLQAIRSHFIDFRNDGALLAKIDAAIEKARDCIYERGLLTKQPCLCHGAVGNALAFDESDTRREEFMRHCQGVVMERGLKEGWYIEGDDQWGLFCGEAGRAWGWLRMVDRGNGRRESAGLIGYSDV